MVKYIIHSPSNTRPNDFPGLIRPLGPDVPHPWSRGSVSYSFILLNPQSTCQSSSCYQSGSVTSHVWRQLQFLNNETQIPQSPGATLNKAKKQLTAVLVCLTFLFSPLKPSHQGCNSLKAQNSTPHRAEVSNSRFWPLCDLRVKNSNTFEAGFLLFWESVVCIHPWLPRHLNTWGGSVWGWRTKFIKAAPLWSWWKSLCLFDYSGLPLSLSLSHIPLLAFAQWRLISLCR